MEIATIKEVCGACKWFRIDQGEDFGLCYLNPPVPVIGSDDDFRMVIFFERPEVDLTDMCSKWEPSQ